MRRTVVLLAACALVPLAAHALCTSDRVPQPRGVLERFTSADCEECWRDARTPHKAARLNQPLRAFIVPAHNGPLGASLSLLQVDNPAVSVTAVKLAEDSGDVIVRLRELEGRPAHAVRISSASSISAAREVDGQERTIGDATVDNGALVTEMKPYALRAFALTLARSPASSPT